MFGLVMIGMGATATLAAAAWLLDRLLAFDVLAAVPDGEQPEEY
jgi:hypothetical protein